MFVNNDFRLLPRRPKAVADKIDLSLHHRKIILGASLKNKARVMPQIGDAGYVQENILGKYCGQSRSISSARQPWRWKFTMFDCMKTAQP